jgi:hypothetical protein
MSTLCITVASVTPYVGYDFSFSVAKRLQQHQPSAPCRIDAAEFSLKVAQALVG